MKDNIIDVKNEIFKVLDVLEKLYIKKEKYTNKNSIAQYDISNKIKAYEKIHDELIREYKSLKV